MKAADVLAVIASATQGKAPMGSAGGPEPLRAEPDAAVPAPVFDRRVFLQRVEGDLDLSRELVDLFLTESPALLAEARRSLDQRDAHGLQRAAHTLKSAANFGAAAAFAAAQGLERVAAEDRLAAAALLALEQEIERLSIALREFLEEPVLGGSSVA